MSITTGLTNTIIQAFSWMLVHSLWQGVVLSFVTGLVLMLTKKSSAAVRYNLVLVLFVGFLITTASTFYYEYNNVFTKNTPYPSGSSAAFSGIVNNSHTYSQIVVAAPVNNTYTIKALITLFSNYFSEHCFLIVILWFIFFMAKSVSLAGNMLYMHRARHYRVYAPDDYWKKKVASLCEKLQLKKAVLLLESGYIKVPVVIGYFKPVILVPMGLIAGIPGAQVEAVLLHELAHIRRNDYAVNFMQSIAEAIFFFNPALLWISKLLREERENCCDDIAIAQTNNKEEFVQALISFKDYSVSMPGYNIAFSGQKSTLLNRVMRIVYQENKTLSLKENGIFIIGIAMLVLTAFTIYPVKEMKSVKPHASIIAKSVKPNFNKQLTNPTINTDKPDLNTEVALVVKDQDTQNELWDSIKNTVENKNSPPSNNEAAQPPAKEIKRVMGEQGNNKFYTRTMLKDSLGGLFDMIIIHLPSSMMATTLHHNAKVAFIIGGILHEESEAANFTQEQINAFNTGKNSIGGAIALAQKRYPDLDLSKYEAYVEIGNNSDNYRPDISP